MALQPWIHICGCFTRINIPHLQWSHGPSAMDTCATRRRIPDGHIAFNGAMALQPWIPGSISSPCYSLLLPSMEPWPFSHGYLAGDEPVVQRQRPSMEPWPFSHGYSSRSSSIRAASITFNGAMALQPWIRRAVRVPGQRPETFNGAMALQPWIRSRPGSSAPWSTSLQWSHGPSAMDTTSSPGSTVRRIKSFNGAMALQPWIPRPVRFPQRVCGRPSMEPWPFSHGYSAFTSPPSARWTLQWSHGPSAMDTRKARGGYVYRAAPSMEPWPFSHGYCGR